MKAMFKQGRKAVETKTTMATATMSAHESNGEDERTEDELLTIALLPYHIIHAACIMLIMLTARYTGR